MPKDEPQLTPLEAKVYAVLVSEGVSDAPYQGFASICHETKLTRKEVRLACRSLTRKGLAVYARCLFTEDGEMAGAGYAATEKSNAKG